MKLSVVIPVYNEVHTVKTILERVCAVKLPKEISQKEIIVIDDYSTDGTRELLSAINDPQIKVILHEKNMGKGAALRTGFKQASGDVVIVQDADLEYDPQEYLKLLRPIIDDQADVVYGSRFIGGDSHRILYFWHSIGNRYLTLLSNMFSDLNLTDMETCYKVIRKKVLDMITIEEDRFGFDPEITAKIGYLAHKGLVRVYEVGISYHGRTYREGKKIGMRDAFRVFLCIYAYNKTPFARFVKYAINGIAVAASQLVSMIILVQYCSFTSVWSQNIANILSMEVSFLVAFTLHSKIAWVQKYARVQDALKQLVPFHLVSYATVGIRIGVFYLLSIMHFDYLLNTMAGIGFAVMLNYMGYDKFVFQIESGKYTAK